jgi:hypothetical protein
LEDEAMKAIEYLDRPPPGLFVLEVMRREARKRDPVALMIDVPPTSIAQMVGARRAQCSSVSRASIAIQTPPGTLSKT